MTITVCVCVCLSHLELGDALVDEWQVFSECVGGGCVQQGLGRRRQQRQQTVAVQTHHQAMHQLPHT